MRVLSLFVVLLFALAVCGCEAMKHDRILGETPWQPHSLSADGK